MLNKRIYRKWNYISIQENIFLSLKMSYRYVAAMKPREAHQVLVTIPAWPKSLLGLVSMSSIRLTLTEQIPGLSLVSSGVPFFVICRQRMTPGINYLKINGDPLKLSTKY